MKTRKIGLLFFISFGVLMGGCAPAPSGDSPSSTNTIKRQVTFKFYKYWKSGFYSAAISQAWIGGDFNSWQAADFDYQFTYDSDSSYFVLTTSFPIRTTLHYKYVYMLEGDTNVYWMKDPSGWTNGISPIPDDYESDGFGGKNAVYTVW